MLGCALAFTASPAAHAQLLANDPFLTGGSNYSVGGINGQNPTVTGFTGAWSGGGSVSATPISYSSPTGYSATSGAGSWVTNGENRNGRPFDSGVTGALGATSGAVYMSFSMQLTTLGSTGQAYQALEIAPDTSGNNRSLQIGYSTFGDFADGSKFGVRVNDNGSFQGALGTADTAGHLFVLKLSLGSGATDSLTVWEDPTDITGTNPTGGTSTTISGFALTAGRFNDLTAGNFFTGGGSPSTSISDIRIGGALSDIAGVPEPSTYVMMLSGFGLLLAFQRRRSVI